MQQKEEIGKQAWKLPPGRLRSKTSGWSEMWGTWGKVIGERCRMEILHRCNQDTGTLWGWSLQPSEVKRSPTCAWPVGEQACLSHMLLGDIEVFKQPWLGKAGEMNLTHNFRCIYITWKKFAGLCAVLSFQCSYFTLFLHLNLGFSRLLLQ